MTDDRKRKPPGRYRPPAKPSLEQIRRGNAFLTPAPRFKPEARATLADIWPLAQAALGLAAGEAKLRREPSPPKPVQAGVRACRVCGCTDERACEGGCYWVEDDLCSACAVPREVAAE